MIVLLAVSPFLLADGSAELLTGAAILNCVLTVFNSLFAWLIGRDKLKFDMERATMQAKIENGEEDRAEMSAAIAKLEKKSDECETDRQLLHKELREFRNRMGDSTDHHRPIT